MTVTLVSISYINYHHILLKMYACLPEAGSKVSCHVVPEIIAAYGAHKHIDCLYNL